MFSKFNFVDRSFGRKILYPHAGCLVSGQKCGRDYINIFGLIRKRVSHYIQDQTVTINTFLFFLLFQFFFIGGLSYQRNSLHLFLKLLQFALVHLDTNIQGREHDSCSSAATTSELRRFPSPHSTLNNQVWRLYTICTLDLNNTSEGFIPNSRDVLKTVTLGPDDVAQNIYK